MCDAGLATLAYYYFDFRDVEKQNRKGLLSSFLSQLCAESDSYCDTLSRFRSSRAGRVRKPTYAALSKCLRDMLTLPGQGPIYIIVDALDECPNTTRTPSAREEVLELVNDLISWRLPNVRLCLTSRPEIDIRTVLESLNPLHLSLHDEIGQKKDIVDYIRAVVHSDRNMRKWREEDQQLVIDTLSEKADGM
jgi:NACHT domain